MMHGSAAEVFGRHEDADWEMFCRGRAPAADPWPGRDDGGRRAQELEPDVSAPEATATATDPRGSAGAPAATVRHFHARVVGLPYPNADGTSRRDGVAGLRRWERVHLSHRPDNPVDANAVEVLRAGDGRQIGFLPAALAAEVVAAAREGTRFLAVVAEASAPPPGDLIAVAPVRAGLLVLALEAGATVGSARRHLLGLMNRH